ncbi:hypothetical protein IFM89_015131, partial [Coptis chinensis]
LKKNYEAWKERIIQVEMPTVWMSFKKSLHCRSELSDVHDSSRNNLSSILTMKTGRSGCSRSISNLRDVIHGSKRHLDKAPICSPRSIGSSELINPIAHEVVLSDSRCELKITGFINGTNEGGCGSNAGSTFVGTLRPGTPGPGGSHTMHPQSPPFMSSATPPRRSPSPLTNGRRSRLKTSATFGDGGLSSNFKSSYAVSSNGSSIVTCPKCGEQFRKWEAAEAHHLSKHAVTELVEGDSSRKIVEIICRTSWLKSANNCARIERVLKVIRHGFSTKKELRDGIGVFTTSTSERAFESVELHEENPSTRKALMVCRVIAGRVHRPLENLQELAGQSGFDSLAGKVGLHSNIEELYLLNARALLPCFVVICKP